MMFRKRREKMIEEKPDSISEKRNQIEEHIEKLAIHFEKAQIAEYVQLLNKPRRLLWINFVGGIARGVGVGFGVTVVLYFLVMLLQEMVSLPVIGEYLSELAKIVKARMETPTIP